jgi:hypothetical protein
MVEYEFGVRNSESGVSNVAACRSLEQKRLAGRFQSAKNGNVEFGMLNLEILC